MGRHTKPNRPADEGDATGADPPENGRRWTRLIGLVPLPLFPMLALVVAVGVVAYAFSTQQISLNFAGGAPSEPHTGNSQVSERGQGDRASRGAERADGLVVAFRVASRTETGYRATATVTNRGSKPVAKWALAFRIRNSRIVSFSGATVVRTGTTGFVRSRPGAPALAPGQSVRVVFVGTGTPRGPYYCILNRLRCTRV